MVVPAIYPTDDYNDHPLTDYDKKFLTNGYAYKIGPPRLRQVRVLPSKYKLEWCNKKVKNTEKKTGNGEKESISHR